MRPMRRVTCKRGNSHFLFYALISRLSEVYLLINLFEKPVHNAVRRFSCYVDRSKAFPLLRFFVRGSVVLYVTFVLSLFVSHLSFFSLRKHAYSNILKILLPNMNIFR